VGRGEVLAGRGSELAHGLVQGEGELGLSQPDGDDLVSHGDVFDVLAEDDYQAGGCPVSHSELVGRDG
jgi:hypothetical protein